MKRTDLAAPSVIDPAAFVFVAGVYFGTRNGDVYASRDEGDSWQLVAAGLPDVLCVRATTL